MFDEVLKSLTNLQDWKYFGLVCFTEIDNRGLFTSELENLTPEAIKVCPRQHYKLIDFINNLI